MNTRFLISLFLMLVARGAYAEQTLFASGLTAPHSTAVGADGSVYLNAVSDDVFNPWATLKYSPAGALLATWKLDSDGQLWLVNASTGQRSAYLKLTQMAVDTSQMYDVNLHAVTDFFGILNPRRVGYHSFALLRRGSQIDLFATGYFLGNVGNVGNVGTDGTFPFTNGQSVLG